MNRATLAYMATSDNTNTQTVESFANDIRHGRGREADRIHSFRTSKVHQ
jgi:hypothetical protein